MLTTEKKRNLRERLEAIETNGGAEGALAEIVRLILEELPSDGDHAAAVRDLQRREAPEG
jgi:hypothetical protein